jgi:hypothetical protein
MHVFGMQLLRSSRPVRPFADSAFALCPRRGTAWNSNFENGQPIFTPAYDRDGNNASFNAAECADIVAIWRAVAEDYAAFDVDVRGWAGWPLWGGSLGQA